MNYRVLLDTETTGTDAKVNTIHQVAGVILDDKNKIVEAFDIKFKPSPNKRVDDGALKACNLKLDDLTSREVTSKEALEKFLKIIVKYGKITLVAYNAHFDSDFIRAWFKDFKVPYNKFIYNNNIDIMTMASEFLISVRDKMKRFNLETVYETLIMMGIVTRIKDDKKFHDALYDVKIEYSIYRALCYDNILETLTKIKEN